MLFQGNCIMDIFISFLVDELIQYKPLPQSLISPAYDPRPRIVWHLIEGYNDTKSVKSI